MKTFKDDSMYILNTDNKLYDQIQKPLKKDFTVRSTDDRMRFNFFQRINFSVDGHWSHLYT